MARKKVYNTAADRQKAHVKRYKGSRKTVVLRADALASMALIRRNLGLGSDTEAINYALNVAADRPIR